jgi:hypothetical protein
MGSTDNKAVQYFLLAALSKFDLWCVTARNASCDEEFWVAPFAIKLCTIADITKASNFAASSSQSVLHSATANNASVYFA